MRASGKGRVVFGITGFKLIIILIAGLTLIGPDKMPEIARTIGQAMKMFNAAKDDMERMIKADMFASETPKSTLAETSGTTVASTLYDNTDDDEEEEGGLDDEREREEAHEPERDSPVETAVPGAFGHDAHTSASL